MGTNAVSKVIENTFVLVNGKVIERDFRVEAWAAVRVAACLVLGWTVQIVQGVLLFWCYGSGHRSRSARLAKHIGVGSEALTVSSNPLGGHECVPEGHSNPSDMNFS